MLYRILPILLLLLLLPAAAIYLCRLRHRTQSKWLRLLFWFPNLYLLVLALYAGLFEGYTAADDRLKAQLLAAIIMLVVPQTLYALLALPSLRPLFRRSGPKRPAVWREGISLLVAIGVFAMLCYGFTMGWRKGEVVPQNFYVEGLPASFDGYRIVQLSDLHVGTLHGHPEVLEDMVRQVNSLNPDAIVFTGDLVNYSPDELTEFKSILAGLRARDGVFSIMGNHDYLCYYRWPSPEDSIAAIRRLQDMEREMGWKLLLNESASIERDDTLYIVGLENDGPPRFPAEARYDDALASVPDGACCLLLQHDPTYWRREVLPRTDHRAALQLSGHTHGMQLRFFGWSPASWIYDEWGGVYRTSTPGDAILYVNQGFGSVMMPFRFGAWPEITHITLHAK